MAVVDYEEFAELAQELIGESGRPITMQKLSASIADPAMPWKGPGAPTLLASQATMGTFVELFSFIKLGLETIDNELLKRSEQVVMVPPGTVDVEKYDLILDGSVLWKIEWARVLKPGPDVVLYWFGVSR